MLVHACLECDTVSINRIAADDDPERILAVFHSALGVSQHGIYEQNGIMMLDAGDMDAVYHQLYGQAVENSMA